MGQFITFNAPGGYKPAAAPVTDPTGYSFVLINDSTSVPTTITPANLPTSGGVTTINKNYTTTTVTGTSEQDMHTYTFAANTFAADGDTYYWNGGVSTIGTASAATNTLRLYINGTVIMTISFTNQGNTTAGSGGWNLTLQRKNSTTLTLIPTFLGQRAAGTNFQWGTAGTQTVTLSSSFIMKVTGQCGQSAGTMSALCSVLTRA
jgi:hypothetical protein